MAEFYIKEMKISGPDKTTAVYEFQPGANIIYGESDSGKSYVVECLDYMFGEKTMRLKASSGYDTISVVVKTPKGEVKLLRCFDARKKNVEIFSTDEDFENFTGTGYGADVLDNFWLRLIGIQENQQVVVDSYYHKERLTWANIKKMFLIKEDNISKTSSVIPSGIKSLSALLFLLTGKDFRTIDAVDSDKEREKKSEAEKAAILKILEKTRQRMEMLLQQLRNTPVDEIREQWTEILARFQQKEDQLRQALQQSRELHEKLDIARKKLASSRLQHENYALLQSLYDARMKRNAFVTEGNLIALDHGGDCTCPFCGARQQADDVNVDAMNASVAELKKTGEEIRRFEEANADLEKRIARQQERVDLLEKECSALDHKISVSYAPAVNEMKTQLDRYTALLELQKEYDVVSTHYSTLNLEYQNADADPVEEFNKFRPKEHFPAGFFESMSLYLTEMVRACGVEGADQVFFERATFDLNESWQDKNTFGEGYRAFYNTAVAFCLFRYLCDHGRYKPGFMIVDSPTQAMELPEDSKETAKLYEYMINNSACGQIFIVDNKIPQDLDIEKAKVYTFEGNGKGFLPDYVRPVRIRKEHREPDNNGQGMV